METQGKGSVLSHERQWKHKAKAVLYRPELGRAVLPLRRTEDDLAPAVALWRRQLQHTEELLAIQWLSTNQQ